MPLNYPDLLRVVSCCNVQDCSWERVQRAVRSVGCCRGLLSQLGKSLHINCDNLIPTSCAAAVTAVKEPCCVDSRRGQLARRAMKRGGASPALDCCCLAASILHPEPLWPSPCRATADDVQVGHVRVPSSRGCYGWDRRSRERWRGCSIQWDN